MSSTIQPIINTPDLDRPLTFYTSLFGAVEAIRGAGRRSHVIRRISALSTAGVVGVGASAVGR